LSNNALSRTLNIPNILTLARMLAVPVIVVLMTYPTRLDCFFATILFVIASLTDYMDGYLARKFNQVSTLGKFLDPLADKLLISSSLIMTASLGLVPGWMVVIIVVREIAVTGLRSLASTKRVIIESTLLAKYKTTLQAFATAFLLLNYNYFSIDFHFIGIVFLWAALISTIWSGFEYFYKFFTSVKYEEE